MSVQILHEAEHTRQHARYKIPAQISIDEKIYKIENWSVGGLAIKNISDLKIQGNSFYAKLIFTFETISTIMDIRLVKKDYNKTTNVLRCSFSGLDKDKLSLIHHIINAYLSGEVVTTNSFIEILKHDRFTKKDLSKMVTKDMNLTQKILHRTKQLSIYGLLTLTILGLLTFISYSAFNKLFIIKNLNAIVSAPNIIIRAPAPSYYTTQNHVVGSKILKGDILASMKLIGGGVTIIESPTDGIVIFEYVLDNEFVDKSEPLLTIMPSGSKPYIEAKIEASKAIKLTIGDKVEVQLSDGKQIQAKIKTIKSNQSISNQQINSQQSSTLPFDYVTIAMESDSNLTIKQIGEVATATINTF